MSSKSIFQQIQIRKPARSKFDLTHERKMSIPFGALIPTMVQEVLPGDSFRVMQSMVARFQAMLAPPMHKVNIYTHFFYVPYRILNNEFVRFINYQGNRPNFSVGTGSQVPYFRYTDFFSANIYGVGAAGKDGSLLDYLGFPTAPNDTTLQLAGNVFDTTRFAAFLPLAYQRIWSDFYRDQNFTQPLFSDDGSGNFTSASMPGGFFDQVGSFGSTACIDPESTSSVASSTQIVELLKLRWRAWEKDYLTSATPYANQGIFEPRVPVTVPAGALGNTPAVGTPVPSAQSKFGWTGGIQYPGQNNNTTDGGGFTITAVRVAAALKRWLEKSARGGVRFTEFLWNHWMVKSSDARIQSAEYLGGGVQPMVTSEVVTTAPASAQQTGVPPGYLAGHGISYGNAARFSRKFEEYGVVMAITSVIPRTSYLYSLPRAFMRTEALDFAFPDFAQLGEQAILGSEVMFKIPTIAASASVPTYTGGPGLTPYLGISTRYPMGVVGASYNGFDLQAQNNDDAVGTPWGYTGRYNEYKYAPDTVHGLFRNNLAFWHWGRMLSPGAVLNNGFVQSNPRMDMFAVLPSNGGTGQYNQHPILLQVLNQVSVVRSLPYFNTPELW